MTLDYAQYLAGEAVRRLEGIEKLIPNSEEIQVTVRPDGRYSATVIVPTVSGATRTHDFDLDGKKMTYRGSGLPGYGVA